LTRKGLFSDRFIILTKTKIYSSKDERRLNKEACITWKVLEPFNESNGEIERFGFRLSGLGKFCDFYTASADELDSWLNVFSKYCILSEIESEYTFSTKIGTGSYGEVYLGKCLLDNEDYAIKTIKKNVLNSNPSNIPALVSEISVMRSLDHTNLLKLHRVYESEDSVYLVMDYIKGGDLLERIQSKLIYTEENSVKFMKQLLEGIHYMHSQSVIHRDLKPDNILLVERDCDFDLKIGDFGLACEFDEELIFRCGSPGYVAPEILKKMPYGQKADIFSAGVIMYILLSGRTPFYGKNASLVLMRNRECKIYFHENYWKNISHQAIDLIIRLTDSNPDSRLNAEQALRHPWFKLQTQKNGGTCIVKNSDGIQADEKLISAELMMRLNLRKSRGASNENYAGSNSIKRTSETKLAVKSKQIMDRLKEADKCKWE